MSHAGEFDRQAAKLALRAVVYKDCGQGGSAKVVLAFGPHGEVIRAGVFDAKLTPEVEKCVLSRFQVVTVPSFTAHKEYAVSWRIHLPLPFEEEGSPERDDEQPVPTSM